MYKQEFTVTAGWGGEHFKLLFKKCFNHHALIWYLPDDYSYFVFFVEKIKTHLPCFLSAWVQVQVTARLEDQYSAFISYQAPLLLTL